MTSNPNATHMLDVKELHVLLAEADHPAWETELISELTTIMPMSINTIVVTKAPTIARIFAFSYPKG